MLAEVQTFLSNQLAFDATRLGDLDILLRLALQVVLFMCSAFFSSSETALFSLSPADLQRLQRARHPQAGRLRRLIDEPRQLIISILCGNELINIAASVNLAGILLALFGDPDKASLLNIVVMVPLLLLFGEVVPKTIAVSSPVRVATRIVAVPMTIWVRIVAPLRWAVRLIAEAITSLLVGDRPARENLLGVDEFRTLLGNVQQEGVINPTERILIENLVRAGETEIEDIMVPRPRICFVSADDPVEEIFREVRKFRHGRVPVYREHRDTLVGFLHAEDLVRLACNGTDLKSIRLEDILRPAVVVPPTKRVDEMFDFFKNNNTRAAAVINEFGGVDGLITMPDVVSFLISGLADAEPPEDRFRVIEPGVYAVSGLLTLETFNKLTNLNLHDDHMTTIGGYVFRHLDRLPKVGEVVVIDGQAFAVDEMEQHLIKRLRIGPASWAEDELEVPPDNAEPGSRVQTAEPLPDAESSRKRDREATAAAE